MESVSSSSGMSPGINAMKKAMDVEGQAVLKLLESIQPSPAQSAPASGADLTGLGTQLDIKA